METLKELLSPTLTPKKPQKVKNDPKFKAKSKVRIEGNLENKVVQLYEQRPK